MERHESARSETGESRYQVDDLVIDVGRQRVMRGDTEIPLSPRSFEFLLALVRAAPDVLTFDQLHDRVWPDTVVGPETITQRVKIVRAALGDASRAPRYIAGVRGRGYRLNAQVVRLDPQQSTETLLRQARSAAEIPKPAGAAAERPPIEPGARDPPGPAGHEARVAASASPAPHNRPIRSGSLQLSLIVLVLFLGSAALWWDIDRRRETSSAPPGGQPAASPAKSVAVLPFTNMSTDPDQEYFSDGLSEELVNTLARTKGLRVIARTSSFSLQDESVDIAAIARKLRVTHVLEGSVRRSGDQVRITAQLIDAATNTQVWAQSYERKLDDVFAVQEEIAAAVAHELELTLSDSRRTAPPPNARAYEHFLRAQFFYNRRGESDIARAKAHYERALAIAPNDARAWSGLAGVYLLEASRQDAADTGALAKGWEAVKKALALDPNLAEAHVRLSHYYQAVGDSAAADQALRTAMAIDPDSPAALAVAAGKAMAAGRLPHAIELQRRAVSLDPAAFIYQANLAALLAADGQLQEAKTEMLRAMELNPAPATEDTVDQLSSDVALTQILILLGELDEASTWIQRLPSGAGLDQCLALIEHAYGRKAESDAALQRLVTEYDGVEPIRIAEVHAYRGEIDESFKWLEAAREQIDREVESSPETANERRWSHRAALILSPLLRPLHADPRWPEHLERQ